MKRLHAYYMQLALSQAILGKGTCSPNPAVGAVIVKNNDIIAEGYHEGPGKPHAERVALEKCKGQDLSDAILYVTLEPCCHFGRTPPCTDAIIESGLRHVVYAQHDTDKRVAGKGALLLRQANIHCDQLSIADIENFYQSYLYWQEHKKPFVTVEYIMNDNYATASFNNKEANLLYQHAIQFDHRCSDAILTTINNLIDVDESTQINSCSKPFYIVDKVHGINNDILNIEFPKNSIFFHNSETINHNVEKLKQRNIQHVSIPKYNNDIDLSLVLQHIGTHGIHDLYIKADLMLISSLLLQFCVQRALIYFVGTKSNVRRISENFNIAPFVKKAIKIQWQYNFFPLIKLELYF